MDKAKIRELIERFDQEVMFGASTGLTLNQRMRISPICRSISNPRAFRHPDEEKIFLEMVLEYLEKNKPKDRSDIQFAWAIVLSAHRQHLEPVIKGTDRLVIELDKMSDWIQWTKDKIHELSMVREGSPVCE